MFAVPLALRAWAQRRLLVWPLAASSGPIRTGSVECAIIMARWPQPAGSHQARGPTALSSSSTCSSRKKRHRLSVASFQAITGLVCRNVFELSAVFRKEIFFLSVLYCFSLEMGNFQFCQNLSLYLVASGSERLAWHYLRSVY